jgi:hypothetical protein
LIKQLRLIIKSIKENKLRRAKIEFYSCIRRRRYNNRVIISNYSIA